MNQEELLEWKDLQHKAFKLQRAVEKINLQRKELTKELFKVHKRLHDLKVKK